jgi:hypothetical protein
MAHSHSPRDILWDRARSPNPHVSEALGIEEWQLRQAIHKIKGRSPLRGPDRVIIYSNGDVADESGEALGNIYDEI